MIQLTCGDIYGQMNATLQFKQSYYQTMQMRLMLHCIFILFSVWGKYSTLNTVRVSKRELISEEIKKWCLEKSNYVSLDPLKWWKSNSHRYPYLALLVRSVLCIPATSVPSERIFSLAGNIVTAKRCSLRPENVNYMIFMNKNTEEVMSRFDNTIVWCVVTFILLCA